MIKYAQINWQLNRYCEHQCYYCPGKWRGGEISHPVERYLAVVEKLQSTRYLHAEQIKWTIGGGEPLHFPNLNLLLRQIKTSNSYVRLDTAGGDSWFNIMEISPYVDYFKITHHYWQNISVLDFIIDMCTEQGKKLNLIVPLEPGKILESKAKVTELSSRGVSVSEQQLFNEDGSLYKDYTKQDINLMYGRPADWEPEQVVHIPVANVPDVIPDPNWIDPRIQNGSPSYTGKLCYAGVDYIHIDSNGWAGASDCRSRALGNIFDLDWSAPSDAFECPMMYCHSKNDRDRIRVNQ